MDPGAQPGGRRRDAAGHRRRGRAPSWPSAASGSSWARSSRHVGADALAATVRELTGEQLLRVGYVLDDLGRVGEITDALGGRSSWTTMLAAAAELELWARTRPAARRARRRARRPAGARGAPRPPDVASDRLAAERGAHPPRRAGPRRDRAARGRPGRSGRVGAPRQPRPARPVRRRRDVGRSGATSRCCRGPRSSRCRRSRSSSTATRAATSCSRWPRASHDGEDVPRRRRARDPRRRGADRGRPAAARRTCRPAARPLLAWVGAGGQRRRGSATTARASTPRCSRPASRTAGRPRPTSRSGPPAAAGDPRRGSASLAGAAVSGVGGGRVRRARVRAGPDRRSPAAFARPGHRARRRADSWWRTRCGRTRGWSAAPGVAVTELAADVARAAREGGRRGGLGAPRCRTGGPSPRSSTTGRPAASAPLLAAVAPRTGTSPARTPRSSSAGRRHPSSAADDPVGCDPLGARACAPCSAL